MFSFFNRYFILKGFNSSVEKKVKQAGFYLNRDFDKAEELVKAAILEASGAPETYLQFEKELKNNLDKASLGDINSKKNISDKERFLQTAKNRINLIANRLMLDIDFREQRIQFITQTLENEINKAKFYDLKGQILYRTVCPKIGYSLPQDVFLQGFAPPLVCTNAFHIGKTINVPHIISDKGEKEGWTSGLVHTSANINFSINCYFNPYYKKAKKYIYACNAGYMASIAHHITPGAGYDGIGGSNAEAAMEYVSAFIEPERILGAREVKEDGYLGEFISNSKVKFSAKGDCEFLKFLTCDHIDEISLIEYFEGRSSEVKHSEENIKVEFHQKMLKLFNTLPIKTQVNILKLAETSILAFNNKIEELIKKENLNDYQLDYMKKLKYFKENSNIQQHMLAMLKGSIGDDHLVLLKSKLEENPKEFLAACSFIFEFEREKICLGLKNEGLSEEKESAFNNSFR